MLTDPAPATLAVVLLTAVISVIGFSNPLLLRAYVLDTRAVLTGGEYARTITSGFFHTDWGHLIFNMISLYFFGGPLEQAGGTILFLAVYLGSILGGSLLALLMHSREPYLAVGASGGVCGAIFACIFFMPGISVYIFPLPLPIPGVVYAIAFVIFSVYSAKAKRDNIGHDAHLGGALVGLLIATAFEPRIALLSPLLYGAVLLGGIGGVVYLARSR